MSPEEKPPEEPVSDHVFEPLSESAELDSSMASENPFAASSEPNHVDSVESNSEPLEATLVDATALTEVQNDDPSAPADPVMAEMAESAGDVLSLAGGATLNPTHFSSIPAPPMAGSLENMSANGGAIGSLVLGVWCVAGSFITNWSIINGVIGLLMGFWGLTSRKQRTAWVGIALCVIGIFLSLIQVSELINTYLNAVDETPF
jgi:hypothetical protein